MATPSSSTLEVNPYSIQWFALRVRSRCERVVASAVRQKGFEEFLPLYRTVHVWTDRSKSVEMPLFPGYVFCRLDPSHRMPLLTIPGALHFVSVGKTPVALDEGEIGIIRTALGSNLRVEPVAFTEDGMAVRLHRGPLSGIEGLLIEAGDQRRIVLPLTALRRSVAIEVESEWVEPVHKFGGEALSSPKA